MAPSHRRPLRSPARLKAPMERLYEEFDWAARTPADAIRYPLAYPDPRDQEVVALLAACLAYGRVSLFGPWVAWALERMGPSPHGFVRDFDPARQGEAFAGFHYRFNRPRDLVGFCAAAGGILRAHGTLGAFFAAGYSPEDATVGPALERFVGEFRSPRIAALFPRRRFSYGYQHLFPRPSTGGACKRLLLYLRWMIRRERPDFGLWTRVPPSALVIPVDTHIEHMARAVGLTRRRSRNWLMAEEITSRLRLLDPADPVKYDFALCHKRMSGDCPGRRDAVVCAPCGLRPVCAHWRGWRPLERPA